MSAMILVPDNHNNFIKARILLDTCSTSNFITENFARNLHLPTQNCNVMIGAINSLTTFAKCYVSIEMHSRVNNFSKKLNFLVIPHIAERVPDQYFPREKLEIPKHVKLADPQFHIPSKIDMLVGSGVTLSVLSVGQIQVSHGEYDVIFQNTLFGWVVVGGMRSDDATRSVACNLLQSNEQSRVARRKKEINFKELNNQIEKFWRIEEVTNENETKIEENACEQHYRANTIRNSTGRYIVRLPFKKGSIEIGNSRSRARRRFTTLNQRLTRDTVLHDAYTKVLDEYITLGHMSLVNDENPVGYYLPHHEVVKLSSNTTKIRVVFDASAGSENGVSLNDNLLVGPTIQNKLFIHLIRFRTYAYVLTADIEKMYRQVLVHPEDRRYQRIFWKLENQTVVYELNTVTFGVASSPFLAIRTIHQLADDEQANFPRAATILKDHLYVDDLLTGSDSLDEAKQIRDEVLELLKRGGFNLRQWASNHQHILDELKEKMFDFDNAIEPNSISKTLGVIWDSQADQFIYSVKIIQIPDIVTKRHILSEVAKIFDPLGLLGPVVLYAKSVMQECWKLKCGWDDSVSQAVHTRWIHFASQLGELKNLTFERRLYIDHANYFELHGFCDASQSGYGACLYMRSVNENQEILVRLACAKSRVAPLKIKTIPQLELCGALTLVQLYAEVSKAFRISFNRIIFWSDSTIALCWIKKAPHELKVFEAHRVRAIQEHPEINWRYVNTKENPADALSRGQLPSEFLHNRAWQSGPEWLYHSESNWPMNIVETPAVLPGVKINLCLITDTKEDIFSRFSSYSVLVKVMAFILRIKTKVKNRGPITLEEKIQAERFILKRIQRDHFSTEINKLENLKDCKNAGLASLSPFLDDQGLLRVGGRLISSRIPYNQKHPLLLPTYHHVTDLIIRDAHVRNFHAGAQSTLYNIRQKFWLCNGKNQIRKIIRKCVTCIRWKPKIIQSQMGNLPPARVNETSAFSYVGIDFFGPLYIKEKKFRNLKKLKAYGCIFVCMASKAIHVEIVSDLTTEGFLGAFKRFSSRRGLPTNVYTDNGTNFIGANNELKELYILFNSNDFKSQVDTFAIQRNISWNFNPPLSPHFGGLWEAAVKSFKHHFKRVVGNQLLTFEVLNTLAIEIEGILNSRPLYTLSSDPNDVIVITPAHLLIGRPITFLPEPDLSSVPGNRLSTWRFITKARQDFWKRWTLEYLSELQKRQKWKSSNHQLGINSVVLLIDKNQSCLDWQLGIIIEVHPGNDDIIRVVTVKTNRGLFKRNVTQLCPLPTTTNNED